MRPFSAPGTRKNSCVRKGKDIKALKIGRAIAWGPSDLNSTFTNAKLLSTKRGSGSLESIEALSDLLQTK